MKDGEPRRSHLQFHTVQLLNSKQKVQFSAAFSSTEALRTIRDGEPRTATSTFTQLLSSKQQFSAAFFVHRDHKDC